MNQDGIRLKGFYQVQIEDGPTGKIVGDSGVVPNTVTNDGKLGYLVKSLGSLAGSSYISYAGIGEGTAPGAAATSLESEITGTNAIVQRASVTAASSGSTALQLTGTFSSASSFVTDTESIKNIGLFASSTAGTIFAGASYATSSCATNQNVNFTYTITFT
jgi:hypothetical protein